ncbi:hypothetical protein VP01_2856g2 [Puccinia sorghi]|uniref:Uncharacterized protein n=1 Tax=Puccinia sorghi TaxID=27349 RepID=A0A0L6V2R3_9BASI|nr:hypothetical protein VP01_2856g2 [Puccinia sorghi]
MHSNQYMRLHSLSQSGNTTPWTSANFLAFMGITSHGITNQWGLMDVVIDIPAIFWPSWELLPMELQTNGNLWMFSLIFLLHTNVTFIQIGKHLSNPQFLKTLLSLKDLPMEKPLETCLFTLSRRSRYVTAFFCITTNNASNRKTLAKHVSKSTNHRFKHHKSLLGCMSHAITLAA